MAALNQIFDPSRRDVKRLQKTAERVTILSKTNKKAAASSQASDLLTGLLQVNTPPYTTGLCHVPHVLFLHDFSQLNKTFM